MTCFTRKTRSCFRFAPPPTPGRDKTVSNNSPPPGPKGWTCPGGCPGGMVTGKIEPRINRKSPQTASRSSEKRQKHSKHTTGNGLQTLFRFLGILHGKLTIYILDRISAPYHRQPKLTPRESEEFINYLWFSNRDVTFERGRYWVTSGR